MHTFMPKGLTAGGATILPCDLVDLMTDLLLLAKQRGHDPCSVASKVEHRLKERTGERC